MALAFVAHSWLSLPLDGVAAAAFVFLGFMGFVLVRLREHSPYRKLGAANRITIFRAALVANLAAMTLYPETLILHGWTVTTLTIVTFALDAADGWAARRLQLSSRFGARLDQELDALFTLVLSFAIYRLGKADAWILIAGGWHYFFHGLRYLSPTFRQVLPFSQRRRAICALSVSLLIACISPLLAAPAATFVALATFILLSASFAVDIVWMLRTGGKD